MRRVIEVQPNRPPTPTAPKRPPSPDVTGLDLPAALSRRCDVIARLSETKGMDEHATERERLKAELVALDDHVRTLRAPLKAEEKHTRRTRQLAGLFGPFYAAAKARLEPALLAELEAEAMRIAAERAERGAGTAQTT